MGDLSKLAISYHSECGKIIDEEFFKDTDTCNIPNMISRGKEWEENILEDLETSSYPGDLSLSTAKNFINFLKNQLGKKDKVFIKKLKVNFKGISLPNNNSFTQKLHPYVEIDLIKAYKQKGNIILEVFEIKYSNLIKEYQVFQAGFYVYILKEIFKNFPNVKVSNKINIIYKKLSNSNNGYDIFERHISDLGNYLVSSLNNIRNIYDTYAKKKNTVLFLNPLCVFRRCKFWDLCYEESIKKGGISLFKSLKNEKRKLFYSLHIDVGSKLKIFGMKHLKVYRTAYFVEKYLVKKYGFWDYKTKPIEELKVIKLNSDGFYYNYENIVYLDVIYKDSDPWSIVLVVLGNSDSFDSKVFGKYEYTRFYINGKEKYLFTFLFCWVDCFQATAWLEFKNLIHSLKQEFLFVYLNEEVKEGLLNIINEEIEFYLNLKDFSKLRKTLELKKTLFGSNECFNTQRNLENLILDEELIHNYMTNEPYSYKLPSFFTINRSYKFKILADYWIKINKICRLHETVNLKVSKQYIQKLIDSVYSPVLPYDLTVFYESCREKIENLETFAIITGVEALLLLI